MPSTMVFWTYAQLLMQKLLKQVNTVIMKSLKEPYHFPLKYDINGFWTIVRRRVSIVQQELVFFRALKLISVFGGICVAQSLVFCVVLCRTIVCILSPGNCCVCTLLATHCLLAYACCTLVLHRPLTTVLHLVLFCTMRSRSCHL